MNRLYRATSIFTKCTMGTKLVRFAFTILPSCALFSSSTCRSQDNQTAKHEFVKNYIPQHAPAYLDIECENNDIRLLLIHEFKNCINLSKIFAETDKSSVTQTEYHVRFLVAAKNGVSGVAAVQTYKKNYNRLSSIAKIQSEQFKAAKALDPAFEQRLIDAVYQHNLKTAKTGTPEQVLKASTSIVRDYLLGAGDWVSAIEIANFDTRYISDEKFRVLQFTTRQEIIEEMRIATGQISDLRATELRGLTDLANKMFNDKQGPTNPEIKVEPTPKK